jgi:hypothetical protein
MDTGIQANFKDDGTGTLINVYGATGPEFDQHLAHTVGRAEQIRAAAYALKGLPTGIDLVKSDLGGEVIAEYDNPAPPVQPAWQPAPVAYQPPPAQPAFPALNAPQPNVVSTYCPRCQQAPICKTCNQSANVQAKSVKNGQYWIHECPTGNRDHKGQWCNPPK